jgi:transcriptional regulator with XRE-family HTH domain
MAGRSGHEYQVTARLAARLTQLRVRRGWSARELADECSKTGGVSTLTRGAISKIECQARKWITPDEAAVLARVFGMTVAELIGVSTSFTIMHLADLRIRQESWPGRDVVLQRLLDDLDRPGEQAGPRPDLVVISGGLTASGGVKEFDSAAAFLADLADRLELASHRIVVVPGDSDVSRKRSLAYFALCEADEITPQPPYFPKWEHFLRMYRGLYGETGRVDFDEDHPWSLFEIVDRNVVVAGLNSTMALSHRAEDDYGQVGAEQVAWFADRLHGYREKGWLRIGVVGHSPIEGVAGHEALRDTDLVVDRLGDRLNLLLHGHGSAMTMVSSELPALGTGASGAAPADDAGPREVPIRRQILQVTADGLTVWARCYDPVTGRWVADADADPDRPGRQSIHRTWRAVGVTFPQQVAPADDATMPGGPDNDEADGAAGPRASRSARLHLLNLIAGVYRARMRGADVQVVEGDTPYVLVTYPDSDDGDVLRQLHVGACVGEPGPNDVAEIRAVHLSGMGDEAELIYEGEAPDSDVADEARRAGIRLRSLIQLRGQLDLRGYVRDQTERLAADPEYPAAEYRPQRFRVAGDAAAAVREDLLGETLNELTGAAPRTTLVFGDPAEGRKFLRQLALRLPEQLPDLLPVLVEPSALTREGAAAKTPGTIEELVYLHLTEQGADTGLAPEKFSVRFRELFSRGGVVLLLDGFGDPIRPVPGKPPQRQRRLPSPRVRGGAAPDSPSTGANPTDPVADQLRMLQDAISGTSKAVVAWDVASLSGIDAEHIRNLRGYRLLQIVDPAQESDSQPQPPTPDNSREQRMSARIRGGAADPRR